MTEGEPKPFRVIIAGGGLVGLNAVHILSSLSATLSALNPTGPKLDFVVLEAHASVTPWIGTLLSQRASVARVHDQLGLLQEFRKFQTALHGVYFFSAETGRVDYFDPLMGHVQRLYHGYDMYVMNRPEFADFMYEHLSETDKARIRLNKKVVRVVADDDGVKVYCEDGTVEEGDILVGADGVRSCVRECMRSFNGASAATAELRAKISNGQEPLEGQKFPYVTSYRMMFGSMPPQPDREPGFLWDGAHHGVSTELMTGGRTGSNRTWWNIYEQLDKPTDVHTRYTEADKRALLDRWAHLYIAEGMTVAEAEKQTDSEIGLVNIEEGRLCEDWHWKRIVLVGDAVRKMTPNVGLGFVAGLGDMVTLSNRLYRLLMQQSNSQRPSLESIDIAFSDYQARRQYATSIFDTASRNRIRQVVWRSPMDRFKHLWVMRYLPISRLFARYVMGPVIADSEVLEWLVERDVGPHLIPYTNHGLQVKKLERRIEGGGKGNTSRYAAWLLLVVAAVAVGTRGPMGRILLESL
ncbi:hypothetical protein BX600DRAFT_477488 [Xylariales sp. PMI_506]|nr:hypothetical protein BX600DRAFT_477488 [Xylariales sp. PMI_506]